MANAPDPERPDKHIDPATGIWPIAEWGSECSRGFVSDARFARPGDRIIPRTSRTVTRRWRKLDRKEG
ncbi:MAG TPA: hypothetical protein VGF49_12745 [Candidatus Solibacter sp.]|jgi:hypothetical protein